MCALLRKLNIVCTLIFLCELGPIDLSIIRMSTHVTSYLEIPAVIHMTLLNGSLCQAGYVQPI